MTSQVEETPTAASPRRAGRGGIVRWLGPTFAALALRDFRVLWIGSAISFVGFMMSMTAQSVVAFELTGNNRAVGTVMFGQGIAMLVLSPFGGVLADRISKRVVLLVTQIVIGLNLGLVGALLVAGLLTLPILAVASFVMGVTFSFLGPARQAYIGDVVAPERRGNAVALSQVALNMSRVAGPFLAGALIAWQPVGAAGTYLLMAAMFAVVVLTMAQLPPSTPRAGRSGSMLSELALGLRYIAAHPQLSRLVLGFVVVTMVGFSYATVLPGLSIDVLGSGIAGVGILLGISAVGGLVVSLGVAPLADSPRAPLIQLISSAGIGVGLILTGLSPAFAVAALAMLVLGGATSGFQTLNNALVMRHADPAYYGRVMSITMLAFSGVNLVGLPVGLLADAIGERGALLAMGGVVLLAIVLLEVWAGRRAGAEVQGPESSVQSPRRR